MAGEVNPDEVDFLEEKDLYKILGVPRGAKADELKKAYRQKSLRYHPDKNPSPDAKFKFQKITEAYSILSDDKKRLKYDKSGDMDLEDFDMDQFLNMWVGEMMEDGGVVDDMMQSVLPWRDDDEKLQQFMDERVVPVGAKLRCQICEHVGSNKRLMLVHFERKHQYDCEEWAKETIRNMKLSFESFMKQVTGIGDPSGEFLLPDGTKADVSKVPVPDIRAHMQKRVDKAKVLDQVLEMYRAVAGSETPANEESPATEELGAVKQNPAFVPDPKKLSDILGISLEVAEVLKDDKPRLLRRLQKRIDELNEAGMLQDYTIDGLDSDDAHTVDAVLYAAENVFNQEDDEEEEHSMRGG
ncbi:Dnajb5 [Symbiodinium pilosum]|uniref:Dnajb5 protein n=1 Tax=Symbiodinium pilosum TaxID=2952 RepID=A0A812KU92_SYMPI|nr:Dnajb5 [Symbiodinium pilosum]